MPLSKMVVIDKIEILLDGTMQIRQATIIIEDVAEIGRTYKRWVLTPGQNISKQTQKVKNVANLIWTADVVTAYKNNHKD